MEDWKWNATLSGAPQGGVVSPILSNIYLHKLDEFVETVLVPQYTRGEVRVRNPAYQKARWALTKARRRGDREEARKLRKELRRLPAVDACDPGYRRLRYSRYADDHLLGFTGPKAEAEAIKGRLAAFLRDELALELSAEKTLVTHARSNAARYLGYEIIVQQALWGRVPGRRPVLPARHGSAGYPWCARKRRPLSTVLPRTRSAIRGRSWSAGSWLGGASCAGSRGGWSSTRSGSSPASGNPVQASPHGRH